jgi:hypothetical protein
MCISIRKRKIRGEKMKVLDFVGGMLGLYHVVPVNEAHIRVLFDKKEAFMARAKSNIGPKDELEPDNIKYRSSYWTVPFVTKLVRLPLTNIRIDIPDVKLNDKNMAKFMCDVVCFVNIDNPLLAAERTTITSVAGRYQGVEDISADFRAIMESMMRTVSTKQTILEVYMDRNKLDAGVSEEIQEVFPRWGLRLVDLEIKDLKDVPASTIIQDIERKIAATIEADARVKVAEERKRAEIAEATNRQEAEVIKAVTEETYRKRQIEKDRTIAVSEQEAKMKSSEQETLANEKKIDAMRRMQVGTADVERESMVKRAEGDAARITNVGNAEAAVIKSKKVADAEGTEKLALAQQKFNDAATTIEAIKASKEVSIAFANAQAKAYENATINIVAGSTAEVLQGGLLGSLRVGPKEGVAIEQMASFLPKDTLTKILGALSKDSDKTEKKQG